MDKNEYEQLDIDLDLTVLKSRHLLVRSPKLIAVVKIRATLLKSAREFFADDGWIEVTAPTITSLTGSCEDYSTLFALNYFGDTAFLIQTSQLHLEPLIQGIDKVYSINHSYRAEPKVTERHLTEFVLIEAEAAHFDLFRLIETQEALISKMCADVITERGEELQLLDANVRKLEDLRSPFPRITYTEAIDALQKAGFSISWGDDLGSRAEKVLGDSFSQPFFVTHYPKAIKFFNMKEDPTNPKVVLSSDLIAPGHGEMIGASVREDEYEKLQRNLLKSNQVEQMRELGAGPEDYAWYLELRRFGGVPHAGFGLGFERLVKWICDFESVLECIEYPRNRRHFAP